MPKENSVDTEFFSDLEKLCFHRELWWGVDWQGWVRG